MPLTDRFFDVRATKGNDYYLTITESRKRFTGEGYDRHKIFLYKEDFNKFIKGLNEAVEYVRGVPVVKTFGQTIFSFKRFKASIDNYEKWVIEYTKALRLPMMFYTTAINGTFAFLIAGGIIFSRGGVTDGLLLNLIFYINSRTISRAKSMPGKLSFA